MLKFIKTLFVILLISFYLAYFVTIGSQIVVVHKALIAGSKNIDSISLGIFSVIILAFLPIIMWKLAADSEVPMLKETWGFRLLLSQMAMAFTLCLFISKSIFNATAKSIMSFDNSFVLNTSGRIMLIEILSIGVPIILFLYLSKKLYERLLKKSNG